jgi:hemerythrin-like domain-containing protein
MQLLDDLRAEHDVIDPMVGALRTFAARRARGEAGPEDAPRFVRFFRLYADQYHHAREEDVLFPALVRELELPQDRGPIVALTVDHTRMRRMMDEISELLGRPTLAADAAARLLRLSTEWSHALWRHIDAENSVLLPESEDRLRRANVAALPNRPPTEEERAAHADAKALLAAHPPLHDATVMRGEGCSLCPNHGVSCDGVEREWWSDEEKEEFPDHVG